MFALGLAAALVASVLFKVGIVLQAVEARTTPRSLGLRPSLLARLPRVSTLRLAPANGSRRTFDAAAAARGELARERSALSARFAVG